MYNVYSSGSELVTILKNSGETSKVMTSKGEVKEVKAITLEPAKLLTSGIYNEQFMQLAVGGLTTPPVYLKKGMTLYNGQGVKAFVVPMGNGTVRFAAGIPNEAFVIDPPNKINDGKGADFDKLDPTDDRQDNGPGGKNEGTDLVNEMDSLDGMGNEDVPETLEIAGDSQLNGVKQIVIKWDAPAVNGTIEDIKALFGEGQVLPEPTSIVIETGNEKITSQKKSSSLAPVKKGNYGLSPTMTTSCPKCQTKLLYTYDAKTDKSGTECPNCKYKSTYEGSLPGQGVAGQTNPSC